MRERKVMIVDDALFMRTMLRKALAGAENLEVLEAADGPAAVQLYREQHPMLVLLDISMPGMNGIEVLKAIRAFDADACVVMCSAIGQESMILEAVNSGAADFIVKPFKTEQILAAVELASARQDGGGAQ